jgi:hypothetical protein
MLVKENGENANVVTHRDFWTRTPDTPAAENKI